MVSVELAERVMEQSVETEADSKSTTIIPRSIEDVYKRQPIYMAYDGVQQIMSEPKSCKICICLLVLPDDTGMAVAPS